MDSRRDDGVNPGAPMPTPEELSRREMLRRGWSAVVAGLVAGIGLGGCEDDGKWSNSPWGNSPWSDGPWGNSWGDSPWGNSWSDAPWSDAPWGDWSDSYSDSGWSDSYGDSGWSDSYSD